MLATRIEGQTPLLQRCTLRRFHVTDGLNTCDQIAFCALHSFVGEIQTNAARGVARGGPGVPVTPLGRPSFEQTTYNIQVAKTP